MSEDTEKENIISLQGWKKKKVEAEKNIPAKEEESEEEDIPAFDLGARMAGNVFLVAAYAKGYSDGKIHKWMELRWHILMLIVSNFVTIAAIWWALSK